MPKAGSQATVAREKTVTVTDTQTGEKLLEQTVADENDRVPAKPAAKGPDTTGTLDDEDKYISVLYYGPYGTGKTTDVLSMTKLAPELEGPGKVLLVNAEAGAKPTALRKHSIDPSRIVPWPPRGEVLTFDGLERLFYEVAGELDKNPESWLGGVWDSTTAIHDFLLTEVVELDLEQQKAIVAKAGGKRAGNITVRDQFLYEGEDYQRMQAKFKDLMRKYRYLPWHFAMTSLLRRDEDQKTHKVHYGPAVSPKLQNEIGGGPDIVIRTGVIEGNDGPVWWGRTFATGDEPAKDRFGVLPREMVDPSFDRIVAYVRGDLTEATDPEQRRMPGAPTTGKVATKKSPQLAGNDQESVEQAMPMESGAKARAAQAAHEPSLGETPKPAQAKRTPTRPSTRKAAATPKPSELGSDDNPPF